jgi:hypothetical protein
LGRFVALTCDDERDGEEEPRPNLLGGGCFFARTSACPVALALSFFFAMREISAESQKRC